VFRQFKVANRTVRLRGEVFNVTNTPQFSNPGRTVRACSSTLTARFAT
jgi:hypothetical protein